MLIGRKFPKEKYPNFGFRNKSFSEEHKKNISEALKGRKCTKEHRKNVSIAKMNTKFPKELFPNFGNRNKPFTEKHIKNMSESQKGKKVSELTRQNMSKASKGKKKSEEHKKNMRKTANSPEVQAKIRATKIKNGTTPKDIWKTLEYQKAYQKGVHAKPNNLEQFFDKLTPKYVRYVGDFKFPIQTKKGIRFPDFIVEGQDKAIELFGDYYHKEENPRDKIKEYSNVSWKCLIFWENEVYNETRKVLKETLEFIRS
jgi:very-short-patch-repair endonuclease